MKEYIKNNQNTVSVAIISFAFGFSFSFILIQLYINKEIVGNYCARTAAQAQEFLLGSK